MRNSDVIRAFVPHFLRQTLSASKRSAPVSMRNNEPQSLKRSASQHYTRKDQVMSSLLKSARTGTMENLVLGMFLGFLSESCLKPLQGHQPTSISTSNKIHIYQLWHPIASPGARCRRLASRSKSSKNSMEQPSKSRSVSRAFNLEAPFHCDLRYESVLSIEFYT